METKEKLKRRLKINNILIVILLIVLLIILCVSLFKVFSVKDGFNNNDSNLGIACQNEEFVFYYNYSKGLMRKEKNAEKLLIDKQAYSINYYDNKIYYTTPNSKGGIDINCINIDGKENKTLLSTKSSSTKMYLQDSKIYYLTSNPDTISKVDITGENEEVILKRGIVDFKVVDGTIYFADIMGYLYSVDTNGENYKALVEESKFNKFQILDNYIYYFDNENGKLMQRSLKDISKKEEVTDKLDCDIYNVTTNGIYYLNKAKKQIEYVSLNGKKTKEIVKVNSENTKINVIGAKIYYIDYESGNAVTKVIGINGK